MITIEVAVFTTSDPSACPSLQKRAHADLSTFDGFVGSLALRGLEDPKQRADLVAWASPDAAQAAATAIPKDPRFADFMAVVGEVRHFGHYRGGDKSTLSSLNEVP